MPQLEERYGKENVTGVREVIHTEWMSSEHSSHETGVASKEDWEAHRDAQGGGEIECRTKEWRSDEVSGT